MENEGKNKDNQLIWQALAFIAAFYLLALLFTESFWGFHFLTLAPSASVLFTLLIMVGFLILGNQKKALGWLLQLRFNRIGKAAILAVLFGILFHSFNFVNDAYGDALRHQKFLPEVVEELNQDRAAKAFTMNVFQSKIGEITVLNAVEIISYETGAKVTEVFRWIGTIFGMVFIFCWALFTDRYFEKNRMSNVILILGLLSPFIQLFFGHIEIYAPAITMTASTLMCLLLFLKEKKKLWGVLMLVSLLFAMKFHFVSILMLPTCALAWGSYFKESLASHITWKKMWLWAIVPVVIIGIFAYIFIFKDHADPRFLNGEIDTSERLFLPTFSPEAPLDRYNLFSWNHLWDFFNVFFLWSVGGVFVLIVTIFRRGKVDWHHHGLILLAMTLIFYVGLFFMVNPLLSMPIDFDLFSLPAPVFLLFSAVLLSQVKDGEFAVKMAVPVLMLSTLTIPIIATNHNVEATSNRLEYLGRHTFKTYWIRSIQTLRVGLEMDPENYEKRLLSNIKKLEPYAIKGKDQEYANLLWKTGQLYRKNGNAEEALKWHLASREYFADLNYNRIGIVESFYLLGQFDEALNESMELVKRKHPSEERALNIAFDCAIQAKNKEAVLKLGKRLQVLFPENSYYTEIMHAFQKD
ncbi:MAG: tetratricopeptide repeat protein [bacterium]|nr:tetratricopeptide repeat protein [bacterium]